MVRNLLRHDRAIVLTALLAVAAVAWAYLLLGANMRVAGSGPVMPMAPAWTAGYAAVMFVMWASMMLAMMLPAAAPAILLVAALLRERGVHRVFDSTGLFVLGYVLVWFGFSLIAVAIQWSLSKVSWLSAGMASNSSMLTGLLLVAAGIYQWSRLKRVCLSHCRSPVEPLTKYWRHGGAGPCLSGAWHGAYCLGCCWLLMGLLFVGGAMNLFWAALLALLVLIEKTFPFGVLVSRLSGVVLVVAGTVVLLA